MIVLAYFGISIQNVMHRQGDRSRRIPPGGPNSQFCVLLWYFMVTEWKCAKTSPQTLATKELGVVSWQCIVWQFLFRPKQHDCRPISLFPRLKITLKGRHFDTVVMMEAELQAVLNSLTEHVFQDAFKNGRSTGNGANTRCILWGWWWPIGPELVFDRMAAPVPEIMDDSL
jgi:hypothetical protein